MKVYLGEVYHQRTRCSWYETYILKAESEEQAQEQLHKFLEGAVPKHHVRIVELNLDEPYMV